MGFYKPEPLRLHWDAVNGWMVDVPTPLTERQLQGIIDWSVPKQIDRWRSLPVGDKKDQLELAIKDLMAGKLNQRVLDEHGVFNIFKSTERTSTRVISYG